jgi:uncharacterized protein
MSETKGAEMPGMRTLIEHDVDVPMRDGVILRADVWRPDDEARHPAVVFRTPYGKEGLRLDSLSPADCVAAGYAAVVQDVRGRFCSAGEWRPLHWDHEGPDGYDTIEWTAAQTWCDGNVGMAGTSYLGIVQWLAAAEDPPHLRAIAPAMTTSLSLDREQTGGALRLDHIVSWLALTAADWMQHAAATGGTVDPVAARTVAQLLRDPTEAMRQLPLVGLLDVPGIPASVRDLIEGALASMIEVDCARIRIPTLSVSGWYDVFATGTVSLYQAMRATGGEPGRHRLIMGPWTHSGSLPQIQGELNTGLFGSALGSRLPAAHLEFFDRHLRGPGPDTAGCAAPHTDTVADTDGGAPPLPAAVRYFLMGADEWREADEWPIRGATEFCWYLDSDGDGDARTAAGSGRLLPKPDPASSRSDAYRYDSRDPVPSHGGRVLHLGRLVGGPLDQGRLEARDDVLCYTSAALDRPLDAIGRHRVRLYFASSAPDTDVIVKLVDVYPDGRALIVAEGSLRLRYRDGFDREAPLTPYEVVEIRVELGDTAWRFAAGHRLRLDVASSNFPHLDRNLNTGEPIGLTARAEVADQRVWHGAARPSRLELQVLDADPRKTP